MQYKLSELMLNKYNKLFDEVADFYGYSIDDISIEYNGMHLLDSPTAGISNSQMLWLQTPKDADIVIDLISDRFEYLEPFYKYHYSIRFTYNRKFIPTYLRQINESVKIIRTIEKHRKSNERR